MYWILCWQDTPPPGSYNVCQSFEKIHGPRRYSEPRGEKARKRHGSFLSAAPRDLAFLRADPHVPGDWSSGEHTHLFITRVGSRLWRTRFMCVLSGPGHYNPDVKSSPKLAVIGSKEDRFKSPKDISPGPGAYQVNTAHLYKTTNAPYCSTQLH